MEGNSLVLLQRIFEELSTCLTHAPTRWELMRELILSGGATPVLTRVDQRLRGTGLWLDFHFNPARMYPRHQAPGARKTMRYLELKELWCRRRRWSSTPSSGTRTIRKSHSTPSRYDRLLLQRYRGQRRGGASNQQDKPQHGRGAGIGRVSSSCCRAWILDPAGQHFPHQTASIRSSSPREPQCGRSRASSTLSHP